MTEPLNISEAVSIDIVDADSSHATWIENTLRKSQRDASFVARVLAQHLFSARTRVATVAGHDLGWCACAGDIVVYVYVRWSARRDGIATDLLADAAVHAGAARLRAATWTRAADYLTKRMQFSHEARALIEQVAARKNPREGDIPWHENIGR